MAKSEERDRALPLLERGEIQFLFRPRTEADDASAAQDVERLFIALMPRGERKCRLLAVEERHLPQTGGEDRFRAHVWRVLFDRAEMNEALSTRRERVEAARTRKIEPSRTAAEGRYAIVRHERHTHLAYVLTRPAEPCPAEAELNIRREASYVIAVRDPAAPESGHEARFPRRVMEQFEHRKFLPVDPPHLLDYEGAELTLAHAGAEAERELDPAIDAPREAACTASVYRELRRA